MDPFQQAEQNQAAIHDMASMMHEYFKALKKQGFSSVQAFTLTKEYQNTILRGVGK